MFSFLPDPLAESEIDEMLRVADKNQDRKIDLEEFRWRAAQNISHHLLLL